MLPHLMNVSDLLSLTFVNISMKKKLTRKFSSLQLKYRLRIANTIRKRSKDEKILSYRDNFFFFSF